MTSWRILKLSAFVLACVMAGGSTIGAQQETLSIDGLTAPVEIVTDRWGVSHIYAENEHDLFFAQGYSAVRDRLFQFEVWRRQATGTVAEILGERELQRDIGARLHQFRGDMTTEMNAYHDRGDQIIPAFVDGINAYIAETERHPDLLPLEFDLLGITPGCGHPRWSSRVTTGWSATWGRRSTTRRSSRCSDPTRSRS